MKAGSLYLSNMYRRIVGTGLILFLFVSSAMNISMAQSYRHAAADSLMLAIKPELNIAKTSQLRSASFLLPEALITYGFIGLGDDPVRDLDLSVKDLFRSSHPDFRTHIDDYIQYAPALAVYGLNAAGVKGDHRLQDRSLILAMTMVFSSGMVTALKGLTHKERPDASSFHSFPSGHTATAFAGAEFLRMEFKDLSPWYGVGGYLVAVATGTLRVLNNRHWVSDVVGGAGFGILSARLSYLVFDATKKHVEKRKNKKSDVSAADF
jgi:hypothetical protein